MADDATTAAQDPPQLPDRRFGPDSTSAEVELLRSQIFVHSPGIIKFIEAKRLSPFQLGVYEKRFHELAAGFEEFRLLIDLAHTNERPDAPTRARLKEIFVAVSPQVTHCAVFTGRNFILNMAAKFILGGLGFRSLTVHKTQDEALKKLGYDP